MTRIITTAVALMFSSAALADPQVFRWSASDLTSVERVAALHQRAEAQASAFCRELHAGTKGVSRSARCVHEIVSEIVDGVNDRRLTSYAKTGRIDPALLAKR
ncbi:MAG: UrcA family protein [Pseudomonadales bacterium]